ncbi:MAG: FecR domain-containing protein [Thermohalobaculum sp.]|nr:FecR domain-containing protein [Thermohalobaculum sp.]
MLNPRLKFSRLAAAAGTAISLAAGVAGAAEQIGEAKAVIDSATAEGNVGERALVSGAEVFFGERVKTDSVGEAQLLFKDGTRMVIGPNSNLVLDQYVFRSGAADNQFVVRAFSGAFRFITGSGPKDAYLIHTPAATIGVRGTSFDFSVTPGETNLLLMHGGATVCSNDGNCVWADVAQ